MNTGDSMGLSRKSLESQAYKLHYTQKGRRGDAKLPDQGRKV